MRKGDTLVVPKLDRLARSVPDARHIADQLREKGVKLPLGQNIHDPDDPLGKMFFNFLATFAEFEADLIRMRTREGMVNCPGQGQAAGQAAQALRKAAEGVLAACTPPAIWPRSSLFRDPPSTGRLGL